MLNYIQDSSTKDSWSENSLNTLENTLESNRILQMIMQKKYVANPDQILKTERAQYEELKKDFIEDIWHPRFQPSMYYPLSQPFEVELITVQGSYYGKLTMTSQFLHFRSYMLPAPQNHKMRSFKSQKMEDMEILIKFLTVSQVREQRFFLK